MFRVDLADRPGGGESKYKLAAATEGEAEDWKQALAQEVRRAEPAAAALL